MLRNNKFKQKTTADAAIDGAHSNAEVEAAKMQKLLKLKQFNQRQQRKMMRNKP